MDERYQTVYVALSVALTDAVADLQAKVCRQLDLIPRPELHVTFGYLGAAEPDKVRQLGEQLAPLTPSSFGNLKVLGLGGAVQEDDGAVKLLRETAEPAWRPYPRVLWWAVENREEMIRFRDALIAAAIGLGLDKTFLRPRFTPHITLGSNGPSVPGRDWSLWDVHEVDKEPSLGQDLSPSRAPIEKLHITSIPLKAESLQVIRRWP